MRQFPFKLFVAFGVVIFLTACATIGPPLPPSLDLPKPPSDLRAARKGQRIVLTWTIPTMTTDRQRARSFGATRICRAVHTELTECGTAIGEITVPGAPPTNSGKKPTASYTDVLLPDLQSDNGSSFVTYAVEVRNADGRSAGLSNHVRASLVRTLPPPTDLAARVVKEGILLSWTNSIPQTASNAAIQYMYRVSRRPEDGPQSIPIGEVPAGPEQSLTLTDSSIEWQKTYEYRVETVTEVAPLEKQEQVEGDDSPEVKVFADDVFPPAVPSGLQAVFSGPGQKAFVDLIWAPVPDIDLDGYNVYRREKNSQPVKLNSAPVKTPAYRDADVASGKHYFYSVSAMDVRGNESVRSEETEESVP